MKSSLTSSLFFALLVWLLNNGPLEAADFWLYGKLPSPHDQTSDTMQFKFVYMHTWIPTAFWSNDGSSKDGSEPKGSLALRVVNGRFLAKLPVKRQSPLQTEFHVRVWFAPNSAGAFQQFSPDYRLVHAEFEPDKKTSLPLEVVFTGEVFSSASKSDDVLTLGSGPTFRCWVKRRGGAGTFEYEASTSTSIPFDASTKLLMTSSLRIVLGKATHVCLREPKGNPTGTKQVNTDIALQPTTAEQFGESRTWQDSSGRKIVATLRDCDGTVVVLKGADGNLFLISLSSLSASDQDHAKKARNL